MMMMNERQLAPATGFQANLLLRGPPRHNSITTGRVTWRPNRCSGARRQCCMMFNFFARLTKCLRRNGWVVDVDPTHPAVNFKQTPVLCSKMHNKLYFTKEDLADSVERWYRNTDREADTTQRREKKRTTDRIVHNCRTHFTTVERYEVSSTNCKQENVNVM